MAGKPWPERMDGLATVLFAAEFSAARTEPNRTLLKNVVYAQNWCENPCATSWISQKQTQCVNVCPSIETQHWPKGHCLRVKNISKPTNVPLQTVGSLVESHWVALDIPSVQYHVPITYVSFVVETSGHYLRARIFFPCASLVFVCARLSQTLTVSYFIPPRLTARLPLPVPYICKSSLGAVYTSPRSAVTCLTFPRDTLACSCLRFTDGEAVLVCGTKERE